MTYTQGAFKKALSTLGVSFVKGLKKSFVSVMLAVSVFALPVGASAAVTPQNNHNVTSNPATSKNIDNATSNTISNMSSSITAAQYENYLSNYSANDARSGGVAPQYIADAVQEAPAVLKSFKALSDADQQSVLKQMSEAQTVVPQMEPSDFTRMSASYGYSAKKQARSTQFTWNTKGNRYMPSLTTFFVKVNYLTKGKKVLKTTSMESYVKRNYNFTIVWEPLSQVRYVTSSNEAYAIAKWGQDLLIKGSSTRVKVVFCSVAGNYSGYRSYTNHNNQW